VSLFPWFRRTPLKPVAAAYCDSTPRRLSGKTPLDPVRFVVLDAETTGFDPNRDRLLSLATVTVKAGVLEMASIHSWLVYHAEAPMTEAVRVHGILPSDTRSGEPESAVLEELLPVISGAVLVGHHIAFDVRMLNAALERHFRIRLRNPTLDTAQLAMNVLEAFRKTGYAGQRAPSLEEVCTHTGINPLERHTAAGDAFTTAELLMVLCAKQTRQLGRPLVAGDLPLARA
jgi:DNA polymerase-3 subunit epsilon